MHSNPHSHVGSWSHSASPTGFRVYVHSTAGTDTACGLCGPHQGPGNGGITAQEAQQWGWKIVYLAQEKGASNGPGQHSATSAGGTPRRFARFMG